MMTEKYPTWLTGHVKEWAQKRLPTVTLCSTTGNELLEVWYYGDLLTLNEEPQPYIVPSYFAPELVTARDPESGEEFVIFDGGRHGYDNMFCDEHDPSDLEHRPLKRYEIPASKLVLYNFPLSPRNRHGNRMSSFSGNSFFRQHFTRNGICKEIRLTKLGMVWIRI